MSGRREDALKGVILDWSLLKSTKETPVMLEASKGRGIRIKASIFFLWQTKSMGPCQGRRCVHLCIWFSLSFLWREDEALRFLRWSKLFKSLQKKLHRWESWGYTWYAERRSSSPSEQMLRLVWVKQTI